MNIFTKYLLKSKSTLNCHLKDYCKDDIYEIRGIYFEFIIWKTVFVQISIRIKSKNDVNI